MGGEGEWEGKERLGEEGENGEWKGEWEGKENGRGRRVRGIGRGVREEERGESG